MPHRRKPREPDLFAQVAAAVAEEHPLALLGLASGLRNALDPPAKTSGGPTGLAHGGAGRRRRLTSYVELAESARDARDRIDLAP